MSFITADLVSRGRWLVLLFCFWPLVSMGIDSGEFMDDARGYFSRGEYQAAVIQLKNALLTNSDDVEARLLLGKTYLELKDGPSALKELKRARDLGVPREAVLLPLGRAYLMTGQSDILLQKITPEADDLTRTRVDILLLQGQAYLAKQRYAMADEKFGKALELQPNIAEALAGKARIALQNGKTDDAADFANRALAEDDHTVDAWLIKAELYRRVDEQQQAISAFQRVLDIAPTNVQARLGKAMSLVVLGEYDKALAETDLLLKIYPNVYLAYYIKALALYQQHQLAQALGSTETALRLAPDHLASRRLAGTIQYQQGHLNQAEQSFRQYLQQRPGDKQVAKLLAATLLKLKQTGAAIEVLEPGVASAVDDAQYLSLLGGAYLKQGDAVRGLEYLEKAAALAPDSANVRTQLAMGYLARGEADEAVGELQAVIDLDQGLLQADLLLVLSYLRNKDFSNAIAAAASLKGKMPDSPVPDNLTGVAQVGQGDYRAARNSYETALQIQPDFLSAYFNLARLDMLAQDPAAAEKRYRKVLTYDEGNLKALLALAVLAQQEGHADQTERWLKQAYKYHPKAIQPALLLVLHYQRQGKYLKALDLARETVTSHPREPQALKVLALSQLQANEDKAALVTLRSLVEVQPQSPEARYQLAQVQLKLKKPAEAKENLQRALALRENFPAARLALGRLEIAAKNFNAAGAIADGLKQAHPDASFGYELEGDIFYSRQAFSQAAGSYTVATGKVADVALTQKLFNTYLKAGDQDAANKVLRQWLAGHPEDTKLRTMLAMALQTSGQRQPAIEEYLQVLEYDANNVTVLNNLAWLHQDAGSSAAVKYAERAYELAPGQPEIADTLGWLLVRNGEINRGLLLLQEAVVKAPHIPDIRYHMIVALDKAGRREEARKELQRLLNSSKTFTDIDKARALHRQWGG